MDAGDVVAGRYRLLQRLGAGGMGEVWRAEQIALGREVALKLVQEGVTQALGDARARFQREAELAAQIEHRNVVDIIDYGTTDEGVQYLVMPLLKGESLDARLLRTPPPAIAELLSWMHGVLGGLAAMHDKGIVHRDLKPANVFLAEDADGAVPKLLDFGISRRAGNDAGAGLTALGTAIGTPRYMAPEQFESARDVDLRADVYSAGAMLYEALAGRTPYESDDAFAIYRAILQSEPPSLASLRPDLPAELAELVHRALSRDPAGRFESARAMRDRLEAIRTSGMLGPEATWLVAPAGGSGPAVAATMAMQSGSTKLMSGVEGGNVAATMAMQSGTTKAMASPSGTQAMASPASPSHAVALPTDAAPAKSGVRAALIGVVVLGLLGAGFAAWVALGGEDDDGAVVTPDPIASVAPDAGSASASIEAPPPALDGVIVSGDPQPLATLALSWGAMPESLRAREGRFVELADGWVIVVPATTPPDVQAQLVTALGAREPRTGTYDASAGLRPALLRTNVRLNIRQRATVESDVVRVLPHDAIVVGLYGTVQGQTSIAEGDTAMTYFIVAERSEGWARSRYLTRYAGCIADPYDLVADIVDDDDPYDTNGDADEDPVSEEAASSSVLARTHAFVDGQRQEVFLIGIPGDSRHDSVVAVYRTFGECEIERISVYRVPGVLDEHFFTETLPSGGQTLVMISYSDEQGDAARGFRQWQAYRLGTDERVWEARLPTAAYLGRRNGAGVSGRRDRAGRAQGGEIVLTVREPGGARTNYVWDDTALVPSAERDEEAASDEAASDEAASEQTSE